MLQTLTRWARHERHRDARVVVGPFWLDAQLRCGEVEHVPSSEAVHQGVVDRCVARALKGPTHVRHAVRLPFETEEADRMYLPVPNKNICSKFVDPNPAAEFRVSL